MQNSLFSSTSSGRKDAVWSFCSRRPESFPEESEDPAEAVSPDTGDPSDANAVLYVLRGAPVSGTGSAPFRNAVCGIPHRLQYPSMSFSSAPHFTQIFIIFTFPVFSVYEDSPPGYRREQTGNLEKLKNVS